MNRTALIGLLLSTSLLVACSAPQVRLDTTEKISERLIKLDKTSVEMQLGSPRSKTDTGPHTSVWVYHSDTEQNKSSQQGKCELVITFDDETAVKAVVNSNEYSPFVHELNTCNQLVEGLQ